MKTKESVLSPRDVSLAMNQMVPGVTIGGCIGRFVAQSTNTVPGVEGVFATLESVVKRLFNLQDPAPKT
ncbi:hypothetical protein [Janthinobacterium agaricidamnosum]|nr:hypothetical protein [Janthinobacterium agaricidamnosum]